jgi:acyl carrier protein
MLTIEIMNNQRIFEELIVIITGIKTGAKIDENTALTEEAILDSLEFMNYITRVEELFDINISDSEIADQKLGILLNMVNYISKINKN